MLNALKALAQDLEERGEIDLSECFVDATFASAKKGAVELVRRSAEKGPRSWQSRTAASAAKEHGIELEVVKLPKAKRGFVLLP